MSMTRRLSSTNGDRRRIALLVGVIGLPAIALGFLAVYAFQSEQVREQLRRQDRR